MTRSLLESMQLAATLMGKVVRSGRGVDSITSTGKILLPYAFGIEEREYGDDAPYLLIYDRRGDGTWEKRRYNQGRWYMNDYGFEVMDSAEADST